MNFHPLAMSLVIVVVFTSQACPANFSVNGLNLTKKVKPLREIKRDHVVSQSLDYSCGTAGLSTVLNYYLGDPVPEAEIITTLLNIIPLEKVKERKGFSLYDLKEYAKQRGYAAVGYKMDMDFLKELNQPVLVPIKFKNYRHFVVVRGIVADRVFIADPAAGNMSMKIDKFMDIWTNGVGLVIEKKDAGADQKSREVSLAVEKDDFVISDYKSLRRLANIDLIQTVIHPAEW